MSGAITDTVIGSAYGKGPYGKGRYSRLDNKSVGLSIASRSTIAVGGHMLWSLIPVEPCEPWTLVAQCRCPSTVVWPA